MRKWWVVWPLYAGLMGFALGASFFFGMYGRNVTEGSITTQHKHEAPNEAAKSKKEEADEALAYYTLWLMVFTGVLAFATVGLGIATMFLYATGEKQFRFAIRSGLRQSREMRASLKVSEEAVAETRRIGEAQVRAYISIKSIGLRFDGQQADPVVTFLPTNSGQSPARNFIWNVGLQYESDGVVRSVTFNRKWLENTGIDIPSTADAPQAENAHIPGMSANLLINDTDSSRNTYLARIRIDLRYTDIFSRDWFDETYFAGVIVKNPHIGMDGKIIHWMCGELVAMPKPHDWDSIRTI